jgi:hypothetical protein
MGCAPKVRFATDSALEGAGFEPSVPLAKELLLLPFDLPAVARKKVSAAFDGGRITSDGGVMLLAQAERRLGIADQLARGRCQVKQPQREIPL